MHALHALLMFATLVGPTCMAMTSLRPLTDLSPTDWVIAGPFPNPALNEPTPAGVTRGGFERDFLASLGGEANAVLVEGQSLASGAKTTKIHVAQGELIDLARQFSDTDFKVAYAQGTIQSDHPQRVYVMFGSDDAARVWLNGKLVHSLWTPGRGSDPTSDSFEMDLVKGENRLMVKVENAAGGWGFHFRTVDDAGYAEIRLQEARRSLPDQEIVPVEGPGYLFTGTAFPRLKWRNPYLLKPLIQNEDLKVRWFDSTAKEVKTAVKPGAYYAYVESITSDMRPLRRLVPFACVEPKWLDFADTLQYPGGALKPGSAKPMGLPIPDNDWPAYQSMLQELASVSLSTTFFTRPEGAQFMNLLTQARPGEQLPTRIEAQFAQMEPMLQIKRELLGVTGNPLKMPSKIDKPATVLRFGTAEEAGIRPDAVAKLDQMCAEWAREEGRPFSAVFARNGVVFLHAGYGELNGAKLDKDEDFYPASIGKAIAGVMFAQFLDQGLIDPEDPVGRFLPDFPKEGDKAITFRNCFTHTSGYVGHNTYGGLGNAWLDNAFSLSLGALDPSHAHRYGGDGNNLAGKAMELITGKPMVRLLSENLFVPLGATSIIEPDLGYAVSAKPMDIAKIGQLILNKGAYGDRRYFSEATYAKMLPQDLGKFYPKMKDAHVEWGLGLSYMPDPDGPREKGTLGANVIGHGSASSSILRIDPDTGIVVVMGRYGVGDPLKHQEYRARTMALLKASVVR